MFRSTLITALIFIVCLVFSTDIDKAYGLLESSTPGIIGAILGGLTAGVSVIFSVLITLATTSGSSVQLSRFTNFLISLKRDILVLVFCLFASLLLPYIRVTGVPLMSYPTHPLIPPRDTLITAAELTVIVISVAIIIEVINIMFSLVIQFPRLMPRNDRNEE